MNNQPSTKIQRIGITAATVVAIGLFLIGGMGAKIVQATSIDIRTIAPRPNDGLHYFTHNGNQCYVVTNYRSVAIDCEFSDQRAVPTVQPPVPTVPMIVVDE